MCLFFLFLLFCFFFFFNDTATTEIYTLSLHDALPICPVLRTGRRPAKEPARAALPGLSAFGRRSEEHTSELQSQSNLVCRLLLEKKKKTKNHSSHQLYDCLLMYQQLMRDLTHGVQNDS